MRSVELHSHGWNDHLSHVLAGFALLRHAGEVDVRLVRRSPWSAGPTTESIVRAVVDGRHRVVFELRDGADVSAAELDWCTHYLKRSYRRDVHGDDPRIAPLGLNYPVSARGDWKARRALWSALAARPATAAAAAAAIAGLVAPAPVARRLGVVPASATAVDVFEAAPALRETPRVLLLTRLWDPERVSGDKAEEWRHLNEVRVGCIVALRDEFGDRFTGGLSATSAAVRDHPDLVVDASVAAKHRYLATVQQSDVCVATAGLRGSNGWRLAEYTAAARAIVSEPLQYETRLPFEDGVHYLAFDDPAGCVAAVRRLVDDAALRRAYMDAAAAYYRAAVRPDAFVRNALAVLPP